MTQKEVTSPEFDVTLARAFKAASAYTAFLCRAVGLPGDHRAELLFVDADLRQERLDHAVGFRQLPEGLSDYFGKTYLCDRRHPENPAFWSAAGSPAADQRRTISVVTRGSVEEL